MAFTKVSPAGIGSTPGDGYRIGDSFLHSTGVEITNINARGILTAASLDISGDIDFDGHTNLDIVSVAGVTTLTHATTHPLFIHADTDYKGILLNGTNTPSVNFARQTSTTTEWRVGIDPINGNRFCVGVGEGISNKFIIDSSTGMTIYNGLGVSGNVTLTDSIIHDGDTDTKIRFTGPDTISAETGGTERLRSDSTGRVMIATTVAGTNSDLTIGDASSGSTGRIRIRSASNGGGYIDFQDTTGNTVDGSIEYNHILNSFNFYFGSQERFRIHTQGMLGLSGANYGTSGQVLTSGGTGSPVSWTTITGTTINNNADNRVITGSGTANTLNGESGVTIDGSNILTILGTGQQQLNVGSTNAGGAAIVLDGDSNGDGAGGDYSLIRHNTSGDLEFYARNGSGATNTIFKQGTTEKFRMGNDGNLTISDGDLVIASGPHGIDFSADSSGTLQTLAGSLNAELLHDYEVGTFTPNIQYDTGTNQYYGSPGSGHYVASSKGEYIRIGDMMYAAGQITLTGNRNSTQTVHISIGGMPYNGLHSSQQNSLMTGWGGAAWPKNDSNSSFRLYYSYHNYTTLNFAFKQTAGNNGIDGFNFHVYYRCTT